MKHSVEQQTISKVLQPTAQSLTDDASPPKSDSAESSQTESGRAELSKADTADSLISSAVLARSERIVQQCLTRTSNVQDLQKRYTFGSSI